MQSAGTRSIGPVKETVTTIERVGSKLSVVWLSYRSSNGTDGRWAPHGRSKIAHHPSAQRCIAWAKLQTLQRPCRLAEGKLLLVRSCSGCCCQNGLQCSHCVPGAPVSTAIPPDSWIVHSAEVWRASNADIPGPCRQVQPVGGSVC